MNAYVQDAILNTIDSYKEDDITEVSKEEFIESVAESLMNDLEDPDHLSDFLTQIFEEHSWDHKQEILDICQQHGLRLNEED